MVALTHWNLVSTQSSQRDVFFANRQSPGKYVKQILCALGVSVVKKILTIRNINYELEHLVCKDQLTKRAGLGHLCRYRYKSFVRLSGGFGRIRNLGCPALIPKAERKGRRNITNWDFFRIAVLKGQTV